MKRKRSITSFEILARRELIAKTKQAREIPRPENYCPDATVQAVYDLTSGQCRFPIGLIGAKNFHFCNQKARDGSSYCQHHYLRTKGRRPKK